MMSNWDHPYYLKPVWKKHSTLLRIISGVLLVVMSPVIVFLLMFQSEEGEDLAKLLWGYLTHSKKSLTTPPGWIAFEEEVNGGETDERFSRQDQAGY